MWDEPYLETCCRAALHRLTLVGPGGRPEGLADQPCLTRLVAMGLAAPGAVGGFVITEAGTSRHAREILRKPAA